jgi:hypothetical protein
MYTIERKAEAEESIDKLQCLGERIELYFKQSIAQIMRIN